MAFDLSQLPDITFAPQSADAVETEIIAVYERIAGVTLQPADPVRLFLEALAYCVCVQNNLIDLAGKQNLLAFASGTHLDHLGALMGVERLAAQPATTTLRFGVASPLSFAVPIPQGTRVTTQSGDLVFLTLTPAAIAPGEVHTDVPAEATQAGTSFNGLLAGQICRLVDVLPYVTAVSNTAATLYGTDRENDDRFRERIRQAPEVYSVAGPVGAYEARTRSVSKDIAAVKVTSPTPGIVDVRFVLQNGELPDEAMIEKVAAALSPKDIRPLTDKVQVAAPDTVDYAIDLDWYLEKSASSMLSTVTQNVAAAVETYRLWQRSMPGRDINPDELLARLKAAGAKRIRLTTPIFTRLSDVEIARETAVTVRFGGIEDE